MTVSGHLKCFCIKIDRNTKRKSNRKRILCQRFTTEDCILLRGRTFEFARKFEKNGIEEKKYSYTKAVTVAYRE